MSSRMTVSRSDAMSPFFMMIRREVSESLMVPPPVLQRHLGNLLDSELGGDVTFEVDGGELFAAHRCVLAARSSVFKAELFGSMVE